MTGAPRVGAPPTITEAADELSGIDRRGGACARADNSPASLAMGIHLVQVVVEAIERLLPEAPERLGPVRDRLDRRRIERARPAPGVTPLDDQAGTLEDAQHPIMDGLANIEDNVFFTATGTRRGTALRSYDPRTGQWAIWWLDERYPLGPVEPPVIGRFENGTGAFHSDDVVDGRKIRTRYIWGHITPTSARWEQATSLDSGNTWETNWIMEFQRTR